MSISKIRPAGWNRRQMLLAGCGAAGLQTLRAVAQEPVKLPPADPDCKRCRGLGLVPLAGPKPYVYVEGQGPFKPADAVHAQLCSMCRPIADKDVLVAEEKERHQGAVEQHKEWEERTGWKLVLVQTRHASIHCQHLPAIARRIGQAVEAFTIHLQKITGSLALTPTRPAAYQQMLLFGQPSWEKFRKVMEGLYTLEQLGQPWLPAREFTAYDFPDVPHAYITPERIRELPPEYQAVKFAATRQMMLATNWKAPEWLWEGLGAYGQQAALGDVRISTVYSSEKGPKKVYHLRDARQQAVLRQLRPWQDMVRRDLRDFEPGDYPQSMGMVAFLLDSEPAKFLELLRLIKGGDDCQSALEAAYAKDLVALAQSGSKWLARG
jgi:hypothetical protein